MDLDKIEELLSRYEEGLTTTDEEKMLKEYFLHEEVPEHLRSAQLLFGFYDEAGRATSQRDYAAALKNEPTKKSGGTGRIIPFSALQMATGIAATLCVIAGSYAIFRSTNSAPQNTPPTPEARLTYQQTRQALYLVSSKLNKGNRQVALIAKIDKAEHLITKK